jgi:hypothetical protein
MTATDRIRVLTKRIINVVLVHTLIYTLYCYVQSKANVLITMDSFLPIILFFCLSPLLLVMLLKRDTARLWAIAIIGVLMSALVYNIYLKFVPLSNLPIVDPDLIWDILYEGLFGVVLILEVIGIYLTVDLLQEIHKQNKK